MIAGSMRTVNDMRSIQCIRLYISECLYIKHHRLSNVREEIGSRNGFLSSIVSDRFAARVLVQQLCRYIYKRGNFKKSSIIDFHHKRIGKRATSSSSITYELFTR